LKGRFGIPVVQVRSEIRLVKSDEVVALLDRKAPLEEFTQLLKRRPDVATGHQFGIPILFLAAERKRSDVVGLLLQHGAKPNEPVTGDWSSKGAYPIHAAVWSGDLKAVELLINAGADTSVKDLSGRLLDESAAPEIVTELKRLMRRGATQPSTR
jgi:ankyrin repeat protein